MLDERIYDDLKNLCDKYYESQEKSKEIVEKFNKSVDDKEKDDQKKKLDQLNSKIVQQGKEFKERMTEAVNNLCSKAKSPIVDYYAEKVMSPIDSVGDTSRYNRINRLRDLDNTVESLLRN